MRCDAAARRLPTPQGALGVGGASEPGVLGARVLGVIAPWLFTWAVPWARQTLGHRARLHTRKLKRCANVRETLENFVHWPAKRSACGKAMRTTDKVPRTMSVG